MKGDKAAKAKIEQLTSQAVEAPLDDDQRPMEMTILTALAKVVRSDESDLKYELLALDPSDFYFADHRAIFATIKALASADDHVDDITVRQRVDASLHGAVSAIFGGLMPSASQAHAYRQRIIDRADKRELYAVGRAFMTAVDQADPDQRADLVAKLQTAVFDYAATKRLVPDVQSEADVLDDFVLDLTRPKAMYPTGFRHLDDVIRGLTPGLFVIAGPPSAGKTTFVKQLADQIADADDGPPVLFFTYEQSAYDIRIKTLARLARVSNEDIKAGEHQREVADAVTRYKRFAHRLKIIEGTRQHTVGAIQLAAQRERHRTGKPPVIIVDYLQKVPTSNADTTERRLQIDDIVTDLRRVVRETDASIVAVSTMSRASYDTVKMSSFKESGGIEYGADIAAILSVEKEDDKGLERSVALVVLKNRNGRRGIVDLVYKMDHDRFWSTGTRFTNYTDAIKTGKD